MQKIPAYERDPYLQELEVHILSKAVEEGRHCVVLDDSILYPEGGGQPADRGWLSEVAVLDVQRRDEEVRHFLERPVEGDSAHLVLDWNRRYDHMQQHTAQHLLTSIAQQRFGWATRSFHIGAETSDIELDCSPPTEQQIEDLEDAVADIVGRARWIRCYRVSREEYAELEVRSRGLPAGYRGDIRLVEIEGVDRNTCGGTHVSSTAEVGAVKVVRHEPIRGGCRLYWVAGKRARQRLGRHESRLAELRELLDTGDADLLPVVRVRLDQIGDARRRIRRLEDRLAESLAEGLLTDLAPVNDLHLEATEASLLRRVAETYADASAGGLCLITAEDVGGILFAVAAGAEADVDLQVVGQEVAGLLGGRGGGAGRVFQGKARSVERRAAALAHLRRLAQDG